MIPDLSGDGSAIVVDVILCWLHLIGYEQLTRPKLRVGLTRADGGAYGKFFVE